MESRQHAAAGNNASAIFGYEEALALAPTDMDVLTVVADGLTQIGERSRAIDALQTALQKNEPSEAVLTIIGRLAQQMDMPEIAEKIFRAAIGLNPGNPAHYTNLANSYRMQEKYDQGIALIQEVLPAIPESASLWSALATLVMQGNKDYQNAEIFYQEALRLEPKNDQVLLNLGNLHGHSEQGEIYYRQAIAVNPQNHQAHVGLAIYLLQNGHLKEGWKHYEHRHHVDTSYTSAVTCTNRLPLWKGKNLKNKIILVMPEQGIGDEILFASNFNTLGQIAKKLIIGCDPRLESVYKRSFPEATIAPYEDNRRDGRRYRSFPTIEDTKGHIKDADYAVWAGSLPKLLGGGAGRLPENPGGYLKADPELVAVYREKMEAIGEGPWIGLSWRSGNMSFDRDTGYMGVRGAQLALRWFGLHADFFCLQYGWDEKEVDIIQRVPERSLHVFEDIDFKADIEANLAIMANLDVVIGPPTATQQFAIASGATTKLITGGLPWWSFGEDDQPGPSYAKNCHWYQREIDNFEAPIWRVYEELKTTYPMTRRRPTRYFCYVSNQYRWRP